MATTMGIKLEERDEMKMEFLVAALTTSKLSGNSTYATWLQFLIRKMTTIPILL